MVNYLKEMIEGVEIPDLLPKHWVPKNEYVEISRGTGIDCQERIILRSDVKSMIKLGWQVTRLTKVSKSMMHAKWKNAIIAME